MPRRVGRSVGDRDRAHRLAALERRDDELEPVALGDGRLLERPRLLGDPLQPLGRGLEVGEHQLGLDHLGVGDRVDLAVGMGDAGVGVGADDVADRVRLADRGEEAVAEPLAGAGAADEAGDVVDLERLVDDRRRLERVAATASSRSSGTGAIATFGSIVVNG